MIRALLTLIVLYITTTSIAISQVAKPAAKVSNQLETQFRSLPLLDALLDSTMVHSPLLKQQDEQIAIRQLQLERKRKQWLEYLNVETYIQYGNNANVISSSFDTGLNNNLNTTSIQTRYGTGLTFKYPIFNLFSRGKDISIARREISSASYQKAVLVQELRRTIIELYSKALLAHSLLVIKVGAMETSSLAVKLGEIDFRDSKISLSDLSKITDANMKNETEYQLALSDLRLSLELLQELSGYKFLSR